MPVSPCITTGICYAGLCAVAHPFCVQEVVAAWCHNDLGLLFKCEILPLEVRVNVLLVQLKDLNNNNTQRVQGKAGNSR